MDVRKQIAENIKRERKIAGLTQRELCELIGRNCMTVSHFETNRKVPKIETLEQMADVMKIDIYRLLPTREDVMTGNKYQKLAARTIGEKMCSSDKEFHALHGMVGEIGELHSIYQKRYQGHLEESDEHRKKEIGDLLWFIAEYCTACGWELEDVMQLNIDKLKARYPDGFEEERSLHRAEDDI